MGRMAELDAELHELPDEVKSQMEQLSDMITFGRAAGRHYSHAQSVLESKQRDYGPKNISQSPGGPLNGLRVRMWDKLARINHLVDNGATPENESLKDSFLDLANYAIIAMMVLDGDWPSE
jgi:hypothetical protein